MFAPEVFAASIVPYDIKRCTSFPHMRANCGVPRETVLRPILDDAFPKVDNRYVIMNRLSTASTFARMANSLAEKQESKLRRTCQHVCSKSPRLLSKNDAESDRITIERIFESGVIIIYGQGEVDQ